MVKVKGSKDKVKHRRTRSDKNRKRKLYAGKKTHPRRNINGNFVTYISKRKRDDPIKVRFCSCEPISHNGLMNFSKETRRKMHRMVYGKSSLRIDVQPEVLSTKENIAELCLDHLWAIPNGYWLLMLWGHSKNKYHCSPRAVCKILISDHPEGMRCRVIPNFNRRSIRRFYFWRDH